jgi:hypothetical protein
MDVAPFKRGADFGADDAVFVGLGDGLEARVEVGMGFRGREDADGGGRRRFMAFRRLGVGMGFSRVKAAS